MFSLRAMSLRGRAHAVLRQGIATAPRLAQASPQLTIDTVNPAVVEMEYAVRGPILHRSMQLQAMLEEGADLPFSKIVQCNIGNPQALGQKPISFTRQVMSIVLNPGLLEHEGLFNDDVVARAKKYLGAMPSVGAYSDSSGVSIVREEVAGFITARDGHAANAADIFLTDGASSGVSRVMQILLRSPKDAVLTPIPQYPLYSGLAALLKGGLAPYYLDEEQGWGVTIDSLEGSIATAKDADQQVRALVVINPGNPTGQTLPAALMQDIIGLCLKHKLVLLADEVYQDNIFKSTPFTSFKKAWRDYERDVGVDDGTPGLQLISFHSTSKGFTGECGLRGGYFEAIGFEDAVLEQMVKMASITLCSSVTGQIATGLMINPPAEGDASWDQYKAERDGIQSSLKRRAELVCERLNALEGLTANASEGALYAFARIHLPDAVTAAAKEQGVEPDFLYTMRLLEETGVVMVPGSGFGQEEGTHHFRTTILPAEEDMEGVLDRIGVFHNDFLAGNLSYTIDLEQ